MTANAKPKTSAKVTVEEVAENKARAQTARKALLGEFRDELTVAVDEFLLDHFPDSAVEGAIEVSDLARTGLVEVKFHVTARG